jgi:RNA polymerase sigma factor (sigma-70 family)
MNDWELIQKYCEGSESAFETLVKRHVDYVYCAALRQVRDPSLAEDVSQAVFLLLTQKAKTFRPGTILVSWLCRATQNIAARAIRSESRRQRRELEAATMNPTITLPESDPQWERVAPVLDEALAALPNKDRDAVLLRFISRKPFSQVGAQMGTSEDAAKKRVSRALARLREFFLRRGTTLSIAALGVMLSEHVVHAAPLAVATKIAAGVGAGAATASPAAVLLEATLRDLFWNKVKWGAAIGVGVTAVLLLGVSTMRHNSRPESVAATVPPAVQSQVSSESKRVSAGDAIAATNSADHTLSLLVVRAEDQQPISGAHVLVDGWSTWKGAKRMLDAYTDSKGAIDIEVPPQGANMNVYVAAEDRTPMVSQWRTHEFNVPALSHTVSLAMGHFAGGTVLDEYGSPIPGAKVWFYGPGLDVGKRDNIAFNPHLTASYTDVSGHWTTTEFPPQGASVRVEAPAYTSVSVWPDKLSGYPTNIITVLSNGVALSGRVTSTNGTPIANAQVSRQNSSDYLPSRTDANGYFHWPHIEPGQTFIDVDAEGFETVHDFVWATNAVNECALIMQPAGNTPQPSAENWPQVTVKGTVMDADTGKPIPFFRVRHGDWHQSSSADATMPNSQLIGEGHDGQFEWQIRSQGNFRLQVEANGYLAGVSPERSPGNPVAEFTFKLHLITFLNGRVVTSDGSPIKNAEVTLTGPNMGAMLQSPGKLMDPNYPPGYASSRTLTDKDGNFRLATKTDARGIAVIHESGTALVTFEAATNAPITLQPWGAVEGTLYLNGQPAPNQTLSFGGTEKLEIDPRIMFSFSYGTSTDTRGHFRFDKALPGKATITRFVGVATTGTAVINPDQTTDVEVKSGQVVTVDLRRDGRPVIGRLVIQGATEDIDWGMSEGSLSGGKKYPFALSRDGAIRADDVPPGTYTLSIELRAVSAYPLMNQKTFASLQKKIIVPASGNESRPVNLGDLTIAPAK